MDATEVDISSSKNSGINLFFSQKCVQINQFLLNASKTSFFINGD